MELMVVSLGGDRHRITIGAHELIVDQPREAGGDDAGPTPTDLFVASLASCIAHYARRALGSGGGNPTVYCKWEMSDQPPARVAGISIEIHLPAGTSDARMAAVRRAVPHCTVHNSLLWPPSLTIRTSLIPAPGDTIPAGVSR